MHATFVVFMVYGMSNFFYGIFLLESGKMYQYAYLNFIFSPVAAIGHACYEIYFLELRGDEL